MAATSKKTNDDIKKKYKKMTQLEHIRELPDTYIGSVEEAPFDMWVFTDGKMTKKTINIVPGFYKIFDEILVNAIDQYTRLKQENSKNGVTDIRVDLNLEDNSISVYNNGDGIDVVIHPEHKIYVPEMIFGQLLTSANYKKEKKITGGKNGYGAKLTNIFSTEFNIETIDSVRGLKFRQRFFDNMDGKDKAKVTKNKGKPYTRITFIPDLEFFGMTNFDEDILSLLRKRVYDICACTDKKVSVSLNGKKIAIPSFEKYVDLFGVDNIVYEKVNDRWEIAVGLSADDKLEQVSFVNGIYTHKGGKHVDYITKQLGRKLLEWIKLKKKNKSVKQQHIKDNLWVFVKCSVENPSFDSQTKDCLTTPYSKFGSTCELDSKFIDKIAKKTGVVERAIALSAYKEATQISKKEGKKKSNLHGIPKLDDANFAGTSKSNMCTLILTEGDSAKAFAIAGISALKNGRDIFGVFPLKGKLLNVRDVGHKKIQDNSEIQNLLKIIGLQRYKTGTNQPKIYENTNELRYGHVMILTDQDVDGSHIKGLVMNFFNHFWPSLTQIDGFIQSVATPIVKTFKKRGKKVNVFYTLSEFENWKEKTNMKEWDIKYYKGLGTNTRDEAKEIFKDVVKNTIQYTWNDTSQQALLLAFLKENSNCRKDWLLDYDRDAIIEQTQKQVCYDEFIHRDLIHFSNYDNERSIPCMCDGLKPSQRKVLFSCFKRNLRKRIKVSQLSGYVSENSAYHHGEMSLNMTIVSLAQNFIGSNNINYLVPEGQFGTRILGGKDSASPRYIWTLINDIIWHIFDQKDTPLLNKQFEDTDEIEPEFYVPVIPMILVNGCEGIGTGFSTHLPKYNPLEIITNIKKILNGKKIKQMKPWFRGFTGTIEKRDDKYYTVGKYKVINDTTVEITELPVGVWTNKYHEFLQTLVIDSANKKNKKKQIISNIKQLSSDSKIKFVLKFSKATLSKLRKDNKLESILGLCESKSCSITNIHLHDCNGGIKKYKNAEDILVEFINLRLKYYVARKKHMIELLERELHYVNAKYKFIKGFIDKDFEIQNKEDEEVEDILDEYGLPKLPRNFVQNGADDENASYDYLIDMPMRSLTKKRVEQLKKQQEDRTVELEELQSKTVKSMWLDDLGVVEKLYKKMIKNDE